MNYFKSSKTQNRESGDEAVAHGSGHFRSYAHLDDESFGDLLSRWIDEWDAEGLRKGRRNLDTNEGVSPSPQSDLKEKDVSPDFEEVQPKPPTRIRYHFVKVPCEHQVTVVLEELERLGWQDQTLPSSAR